jgi:hypothetical protein
MPRATTSFSASTPSGRSPDSRTEPSEHRAGAIAFDRLQIELAGEADSVFATAGGFLGGEGEEEVIAPLTLGDRALGRGTLTVARDGGPPFTSEEVEMVTLLASQVAGAVENIRVLRSSTAGRCASASCDPGLSKRDPEPRK